MVLWVFAYGSLVWNPGFEFDEKIIGFIKDYKRVFDLGKLKGKETECCSSWHSLSRVLNISGD